MSLTEAQALEITLVRVLEQTPDNGALWTAGDAREATRASMELVPAKAPLDQFVARRAGLALTEIRKRPASPGVHSEGPHWPTRAAWLIVILALMVGFATDHLAADRRINIVEYPLVLLILWNLLIFSVMFMRWLVRIVFPGKPGSVLGDMAGDWRLRGVLTGEERQIKQWLSRFKKEWSTLSATLNRVRIEVLLHAAALFFATGALASLYVRGFFKEYRAGWESTFFSADSIHAIASFVLTPGALLLNMQIPDVQHIATLRLPEGTGEIARDWIHLYAGSILLWIILPRLLLTLSSALSLWRLRRAFPLPMQGIYFTTLRAIRRGGHASVVVIPFRYELTEQIRSNLSRLLERNYGLTVNTVIQQPVLMGENTGDWKAALTTDEHIAVFVIFNLAATAEPDTHGKLLKKILSDVGGRTPVIPIIDTESHAEGNLERFRERCNQWRVVLDETRCKPVFIDLSKPESDDVLKTLESRLNEHG